jgi:peptide/nickel transport system permease protein
MMSYVIRRVLYAIPILLGVNIFVFLLFFIVNSPDDMARAHLGAKFTTPEKIDSWKREHNLHLPMFFNQGWKRVAAVSATDEEPASITLARPGKYRVIVTDPGIKLVESRTIEFNAEDSDRLEWAGKGLYADPGEYVFTVKGDTPLTITARLEVLPPAAEHRLLIEYQEDISLGGSLTETIFYKRSVKMLFFDFGKNDSGEDILSEITVRIAPSLLITVPALFIGALINIILSMMMAAYRGTYIDTVGTITCVVLISISSLFYIIFGQWILGAVLKLVPISGFDFDGYSPRFLILPITIIVVSGMGAATRFYRTLFLEEMGKQYVQTARAKGIAEGRVFFVHVLKNALIPILTGLVVQLPLLFVGSLLIENFFSIPGMGAYTVQAIKGQDFASVQAMVSLGSMMYIIALLATDLLYVVVDPRVRLES